MLLGLISLFLAQSARWISEICVNSSLFNSEFYVCSEQDLDTNENIMPGSSSSFPDETTIPKGLNSGAFHQCGAVRCFNYNLALHSSLNYVYFMFTHRKKKKKGEHSCLNKLRLKPCLFAIPTNHPFLNTNK